MEIRTLIRTPVLSEEGRQVNKTDVVETATLCTLVSLRAQFCSSACHSLICFLDSHRGNLTTVRRPAAQWWLPGLLWKQGHSLFCLEKHRAESFFYSSAKMTSKPHPGPLSFLLANSVPCYFWQLRVCSTPSVIWQRHFSGSHHLFVLCLGFFLLTSFCRDPCIWWNMWSHKSNQENL